MCDWDYCVADNRPLFLVPVYVLTIGQSKVHSTTSPHTFIALAALVVG